MSKRPLALLAALVLVTGVSGCGGDDNDDQAPATDESSVSEQPDNPEGEPCTYVEGAPAAKEVEPPPDNAAYDGEVEMTITLSAGEVPVTLDAANAPCAVNSFTSLAAQGYFDNTPCHRLSTALVVQVLQCGDPSGSGSGGPGYSFDDELTGQETYPAGTIAMANAGPNTNGSQFFFVYGSWQLTPAYTVLGTVSDEGLDVISEIAAEGVANGLEDGPPATPASISGMTVD